MSKNKHVIEGSTNISHIDYHDKLGTMEICFVNGGTYHYPNCPKHEYEALKSAASAGQHFHRNIRRNYPGIKQD